MKDVYIDKKKYVGWVTFGQVSFILSFSKIYIWFLGGAIGIN